MMNHKETIREEQRLAYSVDEAAALLGCSPGHVRNLIERGQLASAKLGRRRIVRAEDLRALLERSCQQAA